MPDFSRKIGALAGSSTVAISDRARQLQQQGVNVVNLGGGDPDFDTPAHIADAGVKAIRSGQTHYVASQGIPALRQAVAEKLLRENGLSYDPAKEIIATASGKLALYIALESLLDPDDEVLYLEPAWVSYRPLITLVGGRPVAVPLSPSENFAVRAEQLEKKVTPRTKAILINSPNNPTGRVLTEQELQAIRDVAVKHDLWVVGDEIYEHLVYDEHRHVSIATLPDMRERTVVVNGMSKAYAMTGWRLGYLAAPAALTEQILKVQQHVVTCATSFGQVAAAAALQGSQDCVETMRQEYDRRRRRISEALNAIPGVRCPLPEGAFYLFPEIDYKGYDSWQLAEYLISEAHVAVTPGQAFGESARKNIRLTYATSMENLTEAVERIKRALAL
ncbi:pyridoxal phosphate-dependent aminotransferase [Fretibacterium sp. OH1220_COT-178]|uniref:pyridoxal phosphate-dependent aminotransferase n=1 Tax=Fretibacterium sp. OH1220_COT-178 TaxID=2491047 RepID=UPI000F5FB72B|nr:pyridoxal phosphate-dependent aminotransferase [Fretibacterium sp. OH1220_COT-178]RRD65390.1 pyridoxal phosphate-dependent aminotransferase [Fretibacterium sp. OH1220_COT-178]